MSRRKKAIIIPDPSIFKRLAATNMPIDRALAELIDNSIDSYLINEKKMKKVGSTHATVRIDFGAQKVVVQDDCAGMNENDLVDAFRLGKSKKGELSLDLGLIGRYGIGMKAAAMILGKRLIVRTKLINESYAKELVLDIDQLEKKGWYIDPPKKVDVNFEHGTEVEVTRLHREYNIATKEKVKNTSSKLFGHYIQAGNLCLFVDGQPVDAYHEPLCPGTHREISIDIGKYGIVKGWVGMLPKVQTHSGNYGFTLVRNNRVVEEYRKIGIKKSNWESKIVGELFLDNWEVDFTKVKIMDDLDGYKVLDEKLRKEIAPELERNKKEANPGRYKAADSISVDVQAEIKKIIDSVPSTLQRTLATLVQTGERQRKPGEKTEAKYYKEIEQTLLQHQIGSIEFKRMGNNHPILSARDDETTGLAHININSDRPFIKILDKKAKDCLGLLFAAQIVSEHSMEADIKAHFRTIQDAFIQYAEKNISK